MSHGKVTGTWPGMRKCSGASGEDEDPVAGRVWGGHEGWPAVRGFRGESCMLVASNAKESDGLE